MSDAAPKPAANPRHKWYIVNAYSNFEKKVAEQLRERGRSVIDAAVEAARIRLRPILMTSLAFILGVMPLVVATGAGQEGRHSVGTAVAGGMLFATFLNIIFIPILYVLVRTLIPGRTRGAEEADAHA